MTNVIDFDALSYADTVTYSVKHPNAKVKDPIGEMLIAGPGHAQTLAFEEAERKRDLEELQDYQTEAKAAIDAGQPIPRTPEERRSISDIRARNAARLAARVISADFSVRVNGEAVEINQATAGALLANPKLGWLYEGLFGFLQNRQNFLAGSTSA